MVAPEILIIAPEYINYFLAGMVLASSLWSEERENHYLIKEIKINEQERIFNRNGAS